MSQKCLVVTRMDQPKSSAKPCIQLFVQKDFTRFQFGMQFNVMMVPTLQEKYLLNQAFEEGKSFKKTWKLLQQGGYQSSCKIQIAIPSTRENKRKKGKF